MARHEQQIMHRVIQRLDKAIRDAERDLSRAAITPGSSMIVRDVMNSMVKSPHKPSENNHGF